MHPSVKKIEIFTDNRIIHVFTNLLQNSYFHGSATTIRISAFHNSEDLIIRYEDNGTGIDIDEKELIFLPKTGKNSGMGLYYVRTILALNGMSIKETGLKGFTGARFDITVPVKKHRIVSE